MLVTVLLSVYNGEKYLKEQLDSLLNQHGVELNVLIRDDGSSDSSVMIINDYLKNHHNFKLITGENLGACASFFELLKNASPNSDFYAFCDQDDFWLENKLINGIQILWEYSTPALYCSNLQVVDEKLNYLGKSKSYQASKANAMIQNIVTGCTTIINQKMFKLVIDNLPNPQEIVMHDSWLYKVATFFGTIYFDHDSYIKYRQHHNNVLGMDANLLGQIKTSTRNFFAEKEKKEYLRELEEFRKIFASMLGSNDRYEIDRYLCSKVNLRKRLAYLTHPYVHKQTFLRNLGFKLQYLIDYN